MSLEDDIIAGMREDYNKTNLQDLNLSESKDSVKYVGMILQSSQNKHNVVNTVSFDPLQTKFLQKLISSNILTKKFRSIKKDYFKATIYADFFTNYIMRDTPILDNMQGRVSQLERIDPYLDPDLGLFARCCAFDYMANFMDVANNDSRRNHFNQVNDVAVEYSNFRRVDPIYESLSCLLYNQLETQGISQRLSNTKNINELSALVFIDINLSLYNEVASNRNYKKLEREVLAEVDEGKYFSAAHVVIEKTSKSLTKGKLSDYISRMEPTTY